MSVVSHVLAAVDYTMMKTPKGCVDCCLGKRIVDYDSAVKSLLQRELRANLFDVCVDLSFMSRY